MKRICFSIISILFILVMITPSIVISSDDIVMIVNKKNVTSKIPQNKLKRIYLKEVKIWDTGDEISPLDIDEKSPLRKTFYANIFEKSVDEMNVYWIKQRITNNVAPPIVMKSSKEIKEYVSQVKGSVGYIEKSALDDSVQELKIEK